MTGAARGSVAERVEAFVGEDVAPQAAAMARGELGSPRWVIEAAAQRGLAGLLVPTEHGGAGATHGEFAAAVEHIAAACASTSVAYDVHVSVATEPIVLFGNDEQRARFLPRLAGAQWLGGFALSEPGSGSDAAGVVTRAVRVAGGWRLNGAKAWITNSGAADMYIVVARTGGPGAHGLSAFVVEADRPGVHPENPLRKMGLRGSWTAGLVLDGVEVPEANLLAGEGQGFRVAMAALDSGRIGIAAQATGIAQGALEAAAAHLRGHGLGGVVEGVAEGGGELFEVAAERLPQAAGRLAGMAAATASARALHRHAAALCDAGERFSHAAAVAKLVATDAAVVVAHEAVELCSPESRAEDHPASVRLRDAKACQIYEGTNQVQRIVIARHLLRG